MQEPSADLSPAGDRKRESSNVRVTGRPRTQEGIKMKTEERGNKMGRGEGRTEEGEKE